jgi:hypothetical protein
VVELSTIKGYAIYNPVTGLFSGKGYSKWNKSPYIWSSLGNLKRHLSMFYLVNYTEKTIRPDPTHKDCVIVDMSTGEVFEGMTIKDHFLQRANWLADNTYRGYAIVG